MTKQRWQDLPVRMLDLAEEGHPRAVELSARAARMLAAVRGLMAASPKPGAAEALKEEWARGRRLYEECRQ